MSRLLPDDGEFRGARAKMRRAKSHLVEVSEIVEQMKDRSQASIVKLSTESGIEFRIVGGEKMDTSDLSSAVGDVLHNLRSSLDQAIAELVRLNGKDDAKVYFPFCEKEGDLDMTIKKRSAHLAGQQAVFLIQSLRPYKGGNVLLRAIHDYDVEDKHRNLVTVSQMVSSPQMGLGKDAHPDGTVYKCDTEFNFPLFGPLERQPVVQSLERMVEATESILESLYALGPP